MSVRLAVVVSHPIQHFAPWHREVARLGGVDLRVFFLTEWGRDKSYFDRGFQAPVRWEIPLLDGYDHEFLPSAKDVRSQGFLQVDNPDISEALDKFSPDVVNVFGWGYRTNWRVASWAHKHRVPLLIYCDSNIEARVKWWKRPLKKLVVSRFYSYVDGAFCVGDNNRRFHRFFGIPDQRLFKGALPIDRRRLLESVPDKDAARSEVRSEYGIPMDAFVVMFCGKYSARKSPLDLVAAAGTAFKAGKPIWALMVGEGDQRTNIEHFCAAEGLRNIALTGFVNQSGIGRLFAAADVLAVTSLFDPHPLVVTEAASFGLPIVASDLIGCIGPTDTAQPNMNALVYRWGDRDQLRAAIELLAADKCMYRQFSSSSIKISESQDAAVVATQLVDAVQELRRLGPR